MKKRNVLSTFILSLAAILLMLPIAFMISNSFMSQEEAYHRYTEELTEGNWDKAIDNKHYAELSFFPRRPSLGSYKQVLTSEHVFLRMYWNSVFLTIPILFLQLFVSPLAAYAFEMMPWRYKENLYFIYLVAMLMPLQVLLVPHYIIANFLGINNTWWAIILPAGVAPFGTFLIRQQLAGIDISLIEAARVEGASEGRIFTKVVLPLIRPTLATLAALTFVDCWNIVDQAIVFIKEVYDEPLSVYLSRMITDRPGLIFAGATLFMIPAILVFLMSHNQLDILSSFWGGKRGE